MLRFAYTVPHSLNMLSATPFIGLIGFVVYMIDQPHMHHKALMTLGMAFAFSAGLNSFVRMAGLVAIPVARSSHSEPTPIGGGIGIFLSITTLSAFYIFTALDFAQMDDAHEIILFNKGIILLCLSLGMGVMGLLDDRYHLRWSVRIILQTIFCITFLALEPLPFLPELYIPFYSAVSLGYGQWILALLWFLGFTNLYNFMDGLNGLVTGFTMIVLLGIIGVIGIVNPIGLCLLATVAAILGFYIYNFPKASLFLGDTGSQFLGFFIAGLAMILPQFTHDRIPLIALPLLFWPFINEGFWTFGRRLYFRRFIFDSHRDYLFHLLNQMGLSHAQVSIIYYSFALMQVGWLYVLRQIDYTYHLLLFVPNIAIYGFWGYGVVRMAKARHIEI